MSERWWLYWYKKLIEEYILIDKFLKFSVITIILSKIVRRTSDYISAGLCFQSIHQVASSFSNQLG